MILNAEFSVDEPIANSSMFNFPKITPPSDLTASETVASYGDMYPSNILDAQVFCIPLTLILSLTPRGTPPSIPRSSPLLNFSSKALASFNASSLATYKNASTFESTLSTLSK